MGNDDLPVVVLQDPRLHQQVVHRRHQVALVDQSLGRHVEQVFTREMLLSLIWESDFAGETRTVDVHIGTLRTKLNECGNMIKTVRGVGYKMEGVAHEQKNI